MVEKLCPNCGKELSKFKTGIAYKKGGKRFCSIKCKKDYTNKEEKIIKEYQRKCKECGKVWHVLASREEKLQKDLKSNRCDQMTSACGMCGGNWMALQSSTQAKRNEHALTDEVTRLKKCPNCGSGNYEEKEVTYEKK